MDTCPFCSYTPSSPWLETSISIALWDGFPVSEGHTLVVPRRHVTSLFDLPVSDLPLIWEFVTRVREELSQRLGVTSFTIGVNDGQPAGQTVGHAHIHVIPRREKDVPDPRGGIRWVIPDKADYWSIKP
jgi:diadenosine tetraphosphate (Ap4A) HIT family hydrolase